MASAPMASQLKSSFISSSSRGLFVPSAPMASQLKSSFISSSSRGLFVPKGLVGGSPVRSLQAKSRPSFTVKAIQAEKATFP
ncbi:uncharacterized protein A4U43_C01F2720, partial [Asparagus officinalis]